jgi:hypothetical protein
MQGSGGQEQPRKIFKAKKRVQVDEGQNRLYDEEGNELEFEGDIIEEVQPEEDVVQRDDEEDEDWEDEDEEDDEDEEMEGDE